MDSIHQGLKKYHHWQKTRDGQWLTYLEKTSLSRLLSGKDYNMMLQFGGVPLLDPFCPKDGFYYHVDPSHEEVSTGYQVQCSLLQTPFFSGDFELIVSPHMHELSISPSLLFQEFYRLLQDQGILIIYGIKRFGLWGGQHVWSPKDYLPWAEHLLSEDAVKNELEQCGFSLQTSLHYGFAPLLDKQNKRQKGLILEGASRWLVPYPSNAYCMMFSKPSRPLTPLKWPKKIPMQPCLNIQNS